MNTDLKYALRMLLKAPGFTIIAVLTLALGIGANSAIFSVVDTVLLRPLPFPHSEQLAMVWSTTTRDKTSKETASFPDFYDYRGQSQSFTAMAAYTGSTSVLTAAGEAQEIHGIAAAGDIFGVMGVHPILGRGFTAEEAKLGQPLVVILGHGLWQRGFGGDPSVVGQQVSLAGRSYTVLGVMPPRWKFPVNEDAVDYITALEPVATASAIKERGAHFLRVVGRVKPGLTVSQAEAEMIPLAARLEQQYPATNLNRGIAVVPLLQDLVGDVRPALLILLSAVALLLLIACANVANLLLARAAARGREIAIRTALGASRARIVRQLLAESLLLALLGGVGGLLLAWWGADLLSTFGPRDVPRLGEIQINLGVAAFTFAVAIASTLVFGLIPALQVSRSDINEALQQGAKGSSGGLHGTRVRGFLVISQVAVSLLLLAGAGLLIKSFFNLRATNPGFEPSRLLVLDQILPRMKYPEPEQQRRFYQDLMPKLAALPGVELVGGANPLPFSDNDNGSSFRIASQPEMGPGNHPDASHVMVVPGYFRTMKVPLRSGRDFDERDSETGAHVAMVNQAFARKFLPNGNPIGEQILLDQAEGKSDALTIIGVVGGMKQNDLAAEIIPEFYQPFAQVPLRRVWLTLRTGSANLAGLSGFVRRIVHEQDPDVYVGELKPMGTMISSGLARPRFNMLLLAFFAGVAMALAAIGIYSVIAYSVVQRTREIGVRMALGAQKGQMLGMMLRQSLTLVLIGLAVGLLAAFAATRLLGSLLYGVGANDVLTYASVVILLGGAALLASFIPARRAMRVDPMVALRYE